MQSFTPKFRGSDYLEQWDRVERWYGEVKKIERNEMAHEPIEHQTDIIHAFFLNVYCLKDWYKRVQVYQKLKIFSIKRMGLGI
jgi:hypothetical protein